MKKKDLEMAGHNCGEQGDLALPFLCRLHEFSSGYMAMYAHLLYCSKHSTKIKKQQHPRRVEVLITH